MRTVAEHLTCSLMLLRFVPMRSGSQQCVKVAQSYRPFTAITRVQIPSGTPNRICNLDVLGLVDVGTNGHKCRRVGQFAELPGTTNNLTTALCALRFCSVIACVYVPSVTLAEACRNSSCMTLISAPVALKSVEYEWRNVCQPIRRLMPSFTAVGRMTLRIRDWPQYGRRPRVFGLAKTQSSSDLYFECSSHATSASARQGSIGMGFWEDSVLQGPTTCMTIDRITLISPV